MKKLIIITALSISLACVGMDERDIPNPPSPEPENTQALEKDAFPFKENFFQHKSVFNIALRDLIEQQNMDTIVDIMFELTKNNDCNLHEVISDKTVKTAKKKCKLEQTVLSALIYDLVNAKKADFDDSSNADTTAQALEQAIFTCNASNISKDTQDKSIQSAFFTFTENNDLDGIISLLEPITQAAPAHQFISDELLKTAKEMLNKLEKNKLYLLFDEEEGKQHLTNAQEIYSRLLSVVGKQQAEITTHLLAEEKTRRQGNSLD